MVAQLYPRLRWADHLPVDYATMRSDSYRYLNEVREAVMPRFLDAATGRFKTALLRESPCLLCGERRFTPEFDKEGLSFVRCAACALVQVNPLPIERVADDFYASEHYSRVMQTHVVEKHAYRIDRFATERVDTWERVLGPGENRACLDVGCASGFVLELAHQRGWRACGVDLNQRAVEVARGKGLDVQCAPLESCTFADASFDVVTLYDVLEHLYRPMDILRRAHQLLKPGGLLVLYVPNYESFLRLVLGVDAFFIWGIFHLTYFTGETLAHAVRTAGFDVLSIETHGMDMADLIWREEHRGAGRPTDYVREHREKFQFVIDTAGWGNSLRLYASRPA